MKKIEQYINFFNLEEILIKEIHEKLLVKHYAKGEYILEAHKGSNSIYFVVEGTVEVSCILDNGNQICLNILRPLEIFGDIEYINKKEVLFDVVAKSDVVVILLPFQIAKDYLENNLNFWKFLAIEGNKKLLNTNKAIFYKSTLKAKDIFLKYVEDSGGEITFKSLDELSGRLNISYRNLTRIIKFYTRKEFSHVSIALDRKLVHMYSFGRLKPTNPFFGGFVHESIRHGTFYRFRNTTTCIYSIEVEDEQYEKIKNTISPRGMRDSPYFNLSLSFFLILLSSSILYLRFFSILYLLQFVEYCHLFQFHFYHLLTKKEQLPLLQLFRYDFHHNSSHGLKLQLLHTLSPSIWE